MGKILESIVKGGGWFLAFFGFTVTSETSKIAAKSIRVAAFVAVMIAAFYAMYTAVMGLVNAAAASLPAEAVNVASALLPSNTAACTTAIFTAYTLRFFYDRKSWIGRQLAET